MKEIKLTQGKVTLVDDEDFEVLNQFKWCAAKRGNAFYAERTIMVGEKKECVLMHCVILNRKGIDHRDHDGLNNQKGNLRFCTVSENAMNNRKRENTSSIYKGVHFHKRDKKWLASIKINGKTIHLGYFASETDAALAYNKKAIELFCEFANLNIINE